MPGRQQKAIAGNAGLLVILERVRNEFVAVLLATLAKKRYVRGGCEVEYARGRRDAVDADP